MPKTTEKFFRTSNLIEDVDDPQQDAQAVAFFEAQPMDFRFQAIMGTYHKTLAAHLKDYCKPGKLRDYSVTVGGRRCMDHEEIPAALEKLYQREPKTWDEVKQWHIDFEVIHPFGDGNGRVGRMLMALQCRRIRKQSRLNRYFDHTGSEASFEKMRQNYYNWFPKGDPSDILSEDFLMKMLINKL